jgi:hypothetical protein
MVPAVPVTCIARTQTVPGAPINAPPTTTPLRNGVAIAREARAAAAPNPMRSIAMGSQLDVMNSRCVVRARPRAHAPARASPASSYMRRRWRRTRDTLMPPVLSKPNDLMVGSTNWLRRIGSRLGSRTLSAHRLRGMVSCRRGDAPPPGPLDVGLLGAVRAVGFRQQPPAALACSWCAAR